MSECEFITFITKNMETKKKGEATGKHVTVRSGFA